MPRMIASGCLYMLAAAVVFIDAVRVSGCVVRAWVMHVCFACLYVPMCVSVCVLDCVSQCR
jgi:hypothetical protein